MKAAMLAALAALALAPAAHAAPVCPKPVIVPGFAAWGKGVPAAQLALGHYALLAMAPATAVRFSPPLVRPAETAGRGGVYDLILDNDGLYRFALAPDAWIDVVSRGARLPLGADQPGPPCSGIAKIVAFRLKAGEYTVQFSGVGEPRLGVMLVGP